MSADEGAARLAFGKPGRFRGYHWLLMTSPPARVPIARYVASGIESVTNRTDPSASANWSPPAWALRNEYRVGHRPTMFGLDDENPISGSPILFPTFGGMATVPHAPFGAAHSFHWQ